jgi:hypothetical protein
MAMLTRATADVRQTIAKIDSVLRIEQEEIAELPEN